MKTKTVLLIDDSEIDNFIHCKILSHFSVTDIKICESAEDALEYVHCVIDQPDLILVDVVMEFDRGFDFIDSYRSSGLVNSKTQIIVLSCSIHLSDKEEADKRNVEYIIKPITWEKMFELL